MKSKTIPCRHWLTRMCLASVLAFFFTQPVLSGPGHDHGHDHGNDSAVVETSPRVTAESETYELVGILKDGKLVIYLDRKIDTSPVTNAKIELLIGAAQGLAKPQPDGTYFFQDPILAQHGDKEVIATITEGKIQDLLVGSLAENHEGHAHTKVTEKANHSSETSLAKGLEAPYFIAGLALFIGILIGSFSRKLLGTVSVFALAFIITISPSKAGPGHDHGDGVEATKSGGDGPRRLPDGTLFLPKPTQRLLTIRTKTMQPTTLHRTKSLIGRVISNPNRTGLVQSTIGGRIKPIKSGMPVLGQRVKAGQVLAYVEPTFSPIDATDVRQKAGELEQKISVLKAQIRRQRRLVRKGIVSKAAQQDRKLELAGLVAQRKQLDKSTVKMETLKAPVEGVIASISVAPGQVVASATTLFHIVDPESFWVEAIAFEQNTLVGKLTAKAEGPDGETMALAFVGRSRALQNQASVLQFRIIKPPKTLNIDSPLRVILDIGAPITGLILPRNAIAQAPNGQFVIFKREKPEIYRPLAITFEELDSRQVLIRDGLKKGDQIIIRNAPLVNQVR